MSDEADTGVGSPGLKKRCNSHSPLIGRSSTKKIEKFYERQNSLLENFENDSKKIQSFQKHRERLRSSTNEIEVNENEEEENEEEIVIENGKVTEVEPFAVYRSSNPRVTLKEIDDEKEKALKSYGAAARKLALVTLLVNITLTIAKAVASYLSGSLSIISSLVDSLVDITSGVVIWLTARAIKKRDPYLYPRGRTRLEPLALVIVSVIMSVASVQMVVQSLESIIRNTIDPEVDIPTIIIMVCTIITKMSLIVVCRRFQDDPSIQVLAQDHRNDCVSNFVALLCAYGAQHLWLYLDPIGAILVSIYIAVTWYITGKEQLVMLSGKSAEPDFINRIIK
uniref:Cation efflux protein transmembrane domain-containing protein n=1 Tax=Acrobeloides nanus TaxID=290746 RepID=A0A914CRL0_9BILA